MVRNPENPELCRYRKFLSIIKQKTSYMEIIPITSHENYNNIIEMKSKYQRNIII